MQVIIIGGGIAGLSAALSLHQIGVDCRIYESVPRLAPIGHGINLHEALQGRWRQPLELFPWLMIFVLLVLVVENLLANKFYRRPAIEDAEPTADSASAV